MSVAATPALTAGDESTPDPLTKALQLASRGLAVLPVAADKRPALPRFGVMSATTDPQVIADAFIESAAPLVGVACGASGLVVVDIDVHAGGENGFRSIATADVDLPATWSHASLSGEGRHIVYSESGQHAPSKPFPGVDLKAGAGYIVWTGDVPESRAAFAPAPAWTHSAARTAPADAAPDLLTRWLANRPGPISGSLSSAVADLPAPGLGAWGNADLSRFARKIVMSAEDFEGGAAAFEAFVAAYAAGPWADDAHRHDAARAFTSAIQYATELDGIDPDSRPWLTADMLAEMTAATPVTVAPVAKPFRILTRADLKALPRPEWIIGGLLQESGIIVLAGEGGLGKSFLAIDWAAHIATGQLWHGRPVQRGRVLYVAGEGVEFYDQRVTAWEEHYRASVPDERLQYVTEGFNLSDAAAVDYMREAVAEGGYSLVILDTLSQLSRVESENDNAELAAVLQQAKSIRQAHPGTSVLIVHHTSKGERGKVRGASAIRNNADAVIVARARSGSDTFTLSTRVEHDGKQKNGAADVLDGFYLHQVGQAAVIAREGIADPDEEAVRQVLSGPGAHGIQEFLLARGDSTEAASKRIRRKLDALVLAGRITAEGQSRDKRWTALLDT
ncbi:AAA family ATPase [Microbacterium sp. cx-55]|uniref:AAA family ATPase n=1 Tax=Microbacterium sp. cx-55 TaxID=2875948 RepID=UPI001CBDF8E8|nr:AAA family ATPase [Microbacterium sp. cx-55]MBZ4485973.1 AAA family ATPase [Microbacterium sp. cx-55]UGB34153.1 AAA family ATPase [Microbacterium sp. cx-55]